MAMANHHLRCFANQCSALSKHAVIDESINGSKIVWIVDI